MQQILRKTDSLLVVSLVLFHFWAFAGAFYERPDFSMVEKRRVFSLNFLLHNDHRDFREIQKFIGAFFEDQFGFREHLIAFQKKMKNGVLWDPLMKNSLKGKGDWLFLGDPVTLNDLRGNSRISLEEQNKIIARINARGDQLKEKGIAYLFVLVPDKPTIYPELLPEGIRNPAAKTRWEDFKENPALYKSAYFLDLISVLQAKKRPDAPLFFRLDSHWNYLASFYAYQEIMARLKSLGVETPIASTSEKDLRTNQLIGETDLNIAVGYDFVEVGLLPPEATEKCGTGSWQPPPSYLKGIGGEVYFGKCDVGMGNVVIFGDSFSGSYRDFFSITFKNTSIFIGPLTGQNQIASIEILKPSVIIEEHVERFLSEAFPAENE